MPFLKPTGNDKLLFTSFEILTIEPCEQELIKNVHRMGSLKVIGVQQAEMINNFKNATQKLLETIAVILFNQICRLNQLTPNTNSGTL